MGNDFFDKYIAYLYKRLFFFFLILVTLTLFQAIIFIYLRSSGKIPLTHWHFPEWILIAFQLGFVLLVLIIQYLFLSNGSLSRFLKKALDEPPPPSYTKDPRLFPLIRVYTLVFFLRMVELIAAYIPAFLGVVGVLVGLEPGNLFAFSVVSFGLLFFAMPSKRFRDEILFLGKFIEDGTSKLSTGGEDVSSFTGSDENGKS